MTPEEYARALIASLAKHFGISTIPNVKVGCEGCPFYDHVRRRCSLGYVACYNPLTKTITFSSPEYINELVATHELLHYVLDVYGRRGYRIGIRIGRSDDSVPIFGLAGLVLSLIGLRLAYSAFRKRR